MEPKKCSGKDCNNKYMPHRFGSIRAVDAGWFLQKDGKAWCPSHIPEWVAAWRPNHKYKRS